MIVIPSYGVKMEIEAWQSLVRVCRRWRSPVLGSPRRLNLQLYCTPDTPAIARDKLDVWPALPLIVSGSTSLSDTDSVIAALEQTNRVRQVDLYLASWRLEKILATMQAPFPELTPLQLISDCETPENIGQFVTARWHSDHPITISDRDNIKKPSLLATATVARNKRDNIR